MELIGIYDISYNSFSLTSSITGYVPIFASISVSINTGFHHQYLLPFFVPMVFPS